VEDVRLSRRHLTRRGDTAPGSNGQPKTSDQDPDRCRRQRPEVGDVKHNDVTTRDTAVGGTPLTLYLRRRNPATPNPQYGGAHHPGTDQRAGTGHLPRELHTGHTGRRHIYFV